MSHSSSSTESSGTPQGKQKVRAGAFDIRTFIGTLIGLYGVVLVLVGIFSTDAAQKAKSGGVNINLYAGIGMVVVAVFFLTWARLRPVVVAVDPSAGEGEDSPTP